MDYYVWTGKHHFVIPDADNSMEAACIAVRQIPVGVALGVIVAVDTEPLLHGDIGDETILILAETVFEEIGAGVK